MEKDFSTVTRPAVSCVIFSELADGFCLAVSMAAKRHNNSLGFLCAQLEINLQGHSPLPDLLD